MKPYYLLTCEQNMSPCCNTIALEMFCGDLTRFFISQKWWGDNIWIFLRTNCYHKNIKMFPPKLLFASWNVIIAVTNYIRNIRYVSAFCLKRWWFQQMPCKNKCHHIQRQCPGWFYRLLLHWEWKYQRPVVLFIFVFKLWIALNKFHMSL